MDKRLNFLRWAATAVLLAVLFMLALTMLTVALDPGQFSQKRLVRMAIAWAPAFPFLWAVLTIRRVASDLREPAIAMMRLPSRLSAVGLSLAAGGLLSLAAGVYLSATARAAGGFPALHLPGLLIGTLGLLVFALSRVVARVVELEAQKSALESELQEFV